MRISFIVYVLVFGAFALITTELGGNKNNPKILR